MNKKLLMVVGMMFLVLSLVVAAPIIQTILNKEASLTQQEITKLQDILPDGYWINETISDSKGGFEENNTWVPLSQDINPQISSCIKIDEFRCKAKIYQKSLVNKDLVITTKYCETWDEDLETPTCLSWKILTKAEIENQIEADAEALLENIALVKAQRDEKIKVGLTDEINLEVNVK